MEAPNSYRFVLVFRKMTAWRRLFYVYELSFLPSEEPAHNNAKGRDNNSEAPNNKQSSGRFMDSREDFNDIPYIAPKSSKPDETDEKRA